MGSIARMAATDRCLEDEKVKELMKIIQSYYQSEQLTDLWWDQELEMQFVLKATLKLPEIENPFEVTLERVYWNPEDQEPEDLVSELEYILQR